MQTGRGQVRLKEQRRRATAPSAHEGAQSHWTRRLLKLARQVEDLVRQLHRHVGQVGGLLVALIDAAGGGDTSIPRCTVICGARRTQCSTYQEKWLSDFLPACKASDVLVLSIPDFTPHRTCHNFLFYSLCTLHTSHYIVELQCLWRVTLSQQRPSFNQISVFFEGHDSIAHAHRARCPALIGPVFKECCHCHCHTTCALRAIK